MLNEDLFEVFEEGPKKSIAVLDLDGVVLDERAFKRALAYHFKHFGVNFWVTYPECKDERGIYQFEKQIGMINGSSRQKEMRRMATHNIFFFLFPDVRNFLEANKDKVLILLTSGEKRFQGQKVSGLLKANILSRFNQIIITEEPKVKHLRRICNSNPGSAIFFVDDKPEELISVRSALGYRIKCMRMNRHNLKPDFRFFEVKDLNEANRAIKRFLEPEPFMATSRLSETLKNLSR